MITTFNPAQAATGVPSGSDITLAFDKNVEAGTGTIVLTPLTGSTSAQSFSVKNTAVVSFSGSTMTIDPPVDLDNSGVEYVVSFPQATVQDISGNYNSGLQESSTTPGVYYAFTTVDQVPPLLVTTGPYDGMTGVSRTQVIYLDFDSRIVLGPAGIIVTLTKQGGPVETIEWDVGTSSSVQRMGGDKIVALTPPSPMTYGATYTLTYPINAFKDEAGNSATAMSSANGNTVSFTIAADDSAVTPTAAPTATPTKAPTSSPTKAPTFDVGPVPTEAPTPVCKISYLAFCADD